MNTNIQAKEELFSKVLLSWYDKSARAMAWRVPPADSKQGKRIDPYFTWLSEIMLQQTQVATVEAYFRKFTNKWPSLTDLAAANEEEILKAWAGLGYYSRARNLKKCAETLVAQHTSQFPQSYEELKKLPGIGDYTASAISAISFGQPVAVVDGNVERVIARLERLTDILPAAKSKVKEIVSKLLDPKRSGDFAQAMMDLGATVCKPKNPKCDVCPVKIFCAANAIGDMERFPVKVAKKQKPTRKGAAFVIQREDGTLYLQKRSQSGLLAGMSEVPTSDWNSNQDGMVGIKAAPVSLDWVKCKPIRHTFTHFHLELEVWYARIPKEDKNGWGNGWWTAQSSIKDEALPTIMRKVIKSALKTENGPDR